MVRQGGAFTVLTALAMTGLALQAAQEMGLDVEVIDLRSLDRAGIPAVSLRVGVPHYLGNAKHPQSSAALLQHLEHVLGVPTGHGMLAEDAMRWRGLHDEAVAEDDQAAPYVMMLEHEYDRRMEAALPSGDDLAAELEKFLRDQRDEPGDGPAE